MMMAMHAPEAFERLMDITAETDYARSEPGAANDAVEMIC